MRRWLWKLLLAIDQFFNVLLWNGDEDETISSNLGKKVRDGEANKFESAICWALDKVDPNHCFDSIEKDEGRK